MGAQYANAILPSPAQAGAKLLCHQHRPDKADGQLAPAPLAMIPRKAMRIMEDDWKEHLPLVMLTNAYCQSHDPTAGLDDAHWTVKNRRLVSMSRQSTLDLRELELSFQEWTQAWARLLVLIKRYYQKDYLRWWKTHFNHIFNHVDRDHDWTVMLWYNIDIRQRTTQGTIDPGIFQ